MKDLTITSALEKILEHEVRTGRLPLEARVSDRTRKQLLADSYALFEPRPCHEFKEAMFGQSVMGCDWFVDDSVADGEISFTAAI